MSIRFIAAVEIDAEGLVHISESVDGTRETVGRWDEHFEDILARVSPGTLFYDERAFDELIHRAQRLLEQEKRRMH